MAVTLAGVGLLVALALTLAPGDAAPGGGGRPPPATRARSAFLQEQLPLKVVLTTPVEIVRAAQPDEPVRVWGRQTLTVVFSRPVIALGSDFGTGSARNKFPFSLSCNLPGKTRWVTTTIARFDPDVDWPSDLDCDFVWDARLRSWDGVLLDRGDAPATRPLATQPLSMTVSSVVSEQASNLTDGQWDAYVGLPDGKRPEVPPDGKVLLQFSNPVNLQLLSDALVLSEGSSRSKAKDVAVAPCTSPAPWLPQPLVAASAPSLDVNGTCAELTIPGGLKADTAYVLRLPRGARYNALSGPLAVDQAVTLAGLRPFQLPLRAFQMPESSTRPAYDATMYRRLELWLPHGLSPSSSVADLAALISLCRIADGFKFLGSACAPEAFSLSKPSKGRVVLTVPSLEPLIKYRVAVAASSAVQDGYGQALKASPPSEFWTREVSPGFAGPSIPSNIALLEPSSGLSPGSVAVAATWPFVVRSPSARPPGGAVPMSNYPDLTTSAASWGVDVGTEASVVKLMGLLQNTWNVFVPSVLGAPSATVTRDNATGGWHQLDLPLAPASNVHVVHTCCSQVYMGNSLQGASSAVTVIVTSSLSASFIQGHGRTYAWVLSSAPGGGPVAGAEVSVYNNRYNQTPMLVARSKTDSSGFAQLSLNISPQDYGSVVGFVKAGSEVAIVPNAAWQQFSAPNTAWLGSLLLDRTLVVPGDKLKVTGFLQQRSGFELRLPPAADVVLATSPPWQPGSGGGGGNLSNSPNRQPRVTVKVDATHGSVHGEVEVPLGAKMGQYTLQLHAPDPASTKGRRLLMAGPCSDSTSSGTSCLPLGAASAGDASTDDSSSSPYDPHAGADGDEPRAARRSLQQLGKAAAGDAISSSSMAFPGGFTGGGGPGFGGPNGSGGDGPDPGWVVVQSLSFTVADPRPPTAELALSVPPWVRPNGSVEVGVTAVSYIGNSVDGAEVTVTWRHAKAQGQLTLTTDVQGQASATIDLGALPAANMSAEGDSMTVEAEWIGPTRERIVQSKSVKIADAPLSIALTPSLDTRLPGVAFGLAAVLTDNADGSEVRGKPVSVTLRPNATNGPDPESPACAGKALESACTLTSGDKTWAQCQLALPCPGVFEVRACAAAGPAPADGQACASLVVGQTQQAWDDAPWRGHDEPTIVVDKPSYSLGATAVLRFQNPYPSARALLMWGSEVASQQRYIAEVAGGRVASVDVPIGPECAGGCAVLVVLDVPRLPLDAYPMPPGVGCSKLFDPRAPHTHTLSLTLQVDPANALEVAVEVSGGSGTAEVDGQQLVVVQPGGTAQVTVDVTLPGSAPGKPGSAADGAEVTVYAVDKAFLDLLPYPLPAPQLDMVLRLAGAYAAQGNAALRVAPDAVRLAFEKVMARLTGIDPWLPVDTTVKPQGDGGRCYPTDAVDIPDDDYVKQYTSALTDMPYTYGGYGSPSGRFGGGGGPCGGGQINYAQRGGPIMDAMLVSLPTASAAGGAALESASNDMGKSAALPSASGPPGGAAASAPAVRVSGNFVVTPLFEVAKAGADGRAQVAFKAPPNLGAFVIRAYAAVGASAKCGSGEGRLVVRRSLSLTPSVPRFVRAGDAFEAGAIITVASAPATVTVNATLPPGAPLALAEGANASLTVAFEAGGGLQQEVRFSFVAAAIGSAQVTIQARIDDGEGGDGVEGAGAEDGLQLDIPVLGQQGDVWVATSFAIAANNTPSEEWEEGMELPDAVPGGGGLALTAGIGYYPSLAAMYALLEEQDRYRDIDYPVAPTALVWATLPALLSYYGRTPSTAQAAIVLRSYQDLATLTSANLGLLYSDPMRWGSWYPNTVDLYLNCWALHIYDTHRAVSASDLVAAAGPDATGSGELAAGWAALGGLAGRWRIAVAEGVVQLAQRWRDGTYTNKPQAIEDWSTLSWVRLVLGAGWVPPSSAGSQIVADLAFSRLLTAAQAKAGSPSYSPYLLPLDVRVRVALTLLAAGQASNPLVGQVADDITSSLRTQGRTAYVAYTPAAAGAADIDTQALSLVLLLKQGATHQLLPKLAAYVASPGGGSRPNIGLISWIGPQAQADVAAALSTYDVARGSAKPDLQLQAAAGGYGVLQATFTPDKNAPVSNTTAWEDLPSPTGSLVFRATGTGEVSIAASLHFVPARLLPFPAYRGIYVEAAIQALEPLTGDPVGRALATVPLSTVVAYTIQVTSPDDLGPVTLSVMMPGGLEPLDPNVRGSSGGVNGGGGGSCALGDIGYGPWASAFRYWYWPICPAQETRPSVVTFSFAALKAGTTTASLRAVAATAGTFVLPPVRAYVDAQPELMGMTAGGSLLVCDGEGCAPAYVATPAAPVDCPDGCSGQGVCNAASGACICDAGWSGRNCSKAQ